MDTLPRVSGYNYDAPTEADAVASLHRVFGPDRGTIAWETACRDALVRAGTVKHHELERVALALASQGGPAAAVARSIAVAGSHARTTCRANRRAHTGGLAMTSDPNHDPIHDEARLAEIVALDLLSDDVDPVLEEVANEAASRLGMPVSLVSVVLDEALHVAGSHGLGPLWLGETRGHPLEWAFCKTSVHTRDAYVVEDTATDATHRANPLVTQDGVRCYAGVPIVSSRGFVLGNLCVVGLEPRTFGEHEMAILRELAQRAVERLEARRR